jgi:hypothetical protein
MRGNLEHALPPDRLAPPTAWRYFFTATLKFNKEVIKQKNLLNSAYYSNVFSRSRF